MCKSLLDSGFVVSASWLWILIVARIGVFSCYQGEGLVAISQKQNWQPSWPKKTLLYNLINLDEF